MPPFLFKRIFQNNLFLLSLDNMIQEWKKVGEVPYEAGYRKVKRKTFMLPNGKTDDYDIIDTGRTASIFAMTKDGKVILARQFRQAQEKILLELPGGYIDEGETPLEAAKRELLEETGYKGNFKFIGQTFHTAYDENIRSNFVVTDCEKVAEPVIFDNEHIEVVLMPLPEFREHLRSG